MRKFALTILASLLLLPLFSAAAQAAKPQKKYHAEHGARMYRHHKRTPAQQHKRNLKYAKEHQARQHRHRAHMKAKRHAR
ncbi:MAG: hypothetical protein JO250_17710 [Armatimonadetes bacterium]|nr:hypothetical protein [Armatimonadota bacterium]